MWVLQHHYHKQPLVLFLSDILPMTTDEEIVALNLTYFLMFSLTDVKFANQTTGLDRLSIQQANNKDDNIKHIQISDLSSANTYLYCVSHCI